MAAPDHRARRDGGMPAGGRVRRRLPAAAAAALIVAVWATPALAHATFSGASEYPAGSDQRLVMDVPEERGPDVHNTGVSVAIPSGWRALSCEAAVPWRCTVAPAAGSDPQVVRWTKDAGAGVTPNDETFVFTARTGPPGTYPFPVNQTYDSGEVVGWVGPLDSEEPAPVLRTVAAGTPSPTPSAPASPAPSPTVTPKPALPASPTPPSPTPAAPPSPAAGQVNELARTGSPAALLSATGGLAALLSAGWLRRRRRRPGQQVERVPSRLP